LGDVDNDGDLDLAVGFRDGANQLFLNDGSGYFTDSGQSLSVANTGRILLADVNCDGDADWVEANMTGEAFDNRVYWNNSQGVFWDSGDRLGNGFSLGLALGDVDGDSNLDMMVGSVGESSPDPYNRIYMNNEGHVSSNLIPGTVSKLSCRLDPSAQTLIAEWRAATDEHTPRASLTYDLCVGTSPGAGDVLSATLPAGPGNVGHTTTYELKNICSGAYYCAVRAVDNGFARGGWTVTGATYLELISFTATVQEDCIEVKWITATELDNAGFNLQRSLDKNSERLILNSELIAARGDELKGATYVFTDRNVTGGITYYYWLEDVDLYGKAVTHGPVPAALASVMGDPVEFTLEQNYPNPFTGRTEIRYGLPADSTVNLTIYNVAGQRVRTLTHERQTSGYRVVHWDGRNDDGIEVPGGIYFCRLLAAGYWETRKMILVR
jgi:hypothetical protein